MNGRVLACFAVEQEASAFRSHIRKSPDVRVLITGMGSRNAAQSLISAVQATSFSFVITSGFAGALDPHLQIGDVLFETTEPDLAQKLHEAGAREGTFHCSESIAVTAVSKAALFASSKADAVEMESGVIRKICTENRIPCATVRAISDTANEDLPLDFNRLLTRGQALSNWKLALAIIRAPYKIPALAKLGRNSSVAARRLSEVLAQIL